MKVVSYSEASRLSGVSRQRISNMKREHDSEKYTRKFFAYDPKTGDKGVDIEHIDWKIYVDSPTRKRVNKKPTSNSTDSKQTVNVEQNNAAIIQFVSICINAATEYFKASTEQMHEFKSLVATEYQKFKDGEK